MQQANPEDIMLSIIIDMLSEDKRHIHIIVMRYLKKKKRRKEKIKLTETEQRVEKWLPGHRELEQIGRGWSKSTNF